MQVEEITQILRESPSVRLIKSRSVDFFLSFVIEAFEGQAAIMQERLHMLLENRLDEQENTLVEDDSEMTRLVESNEQKAKRLIKDWTDKGFLTNYQNEEGEVIYEISSHTSKLIDWVVSLKKEDYTAESWKAFETALNAAKETAADKDAAQTEVDNALNVLNAAVAKLEKVKDPNQQQPVQPQPEQTKPDKTTPQTGDRTNAALLFGCAVLSGAGVFFAYRRRRTIK